MKIRLMKISDYEKVYALWISCKNMGLNNLDDSREGIQKFLERNPSTCFVAEDESFASNEKIIAGAILAGNDGRRGYIYHTCVAVEFRRRGIGSLLVKECLAALKREKINKAALVVFERNKDGNDFWEKQEFTRREDIVYRNKAFVQMIRNDT